MTTDLRALDLVRRRHPVADLPLAALLALALDVWRPLPAWGGFPWRWLDLVAVVALGWCAWTQARRATRVSVTTPLDLNLLAMVVLGLVLAVPEAARGESISWLHVGLACLSFYFVGVIAARRHGVLPALGPAIVLAVVVPGLHALWRATGGLAVLAADSAVVDAAWGANHGAFKLLLFALPLAVGRAAEPDASPLWRGVVLVGVVGLGLHVAADGSGLAASAFVRLSDPLFFSNLVVSLLVVIAVLRMALRLAHEEPARRLRWQGIAAAFGVLAVLAVLGEVTAGAGVRTLAALAAATVVAASEDAGRAEPEETTPPLALDRAA